MALSSHEDTGALGILFSKLQQAPQRFGASRYQSNSVTAKAAGATSAAVHSISGANCKRAMWWAYMLRSVEKQLLALRNTAEHDNIKDALRIVHLEPTLVAFQHARQLLCEWWGEEPSMNAVRQYFWTQ